MLEAGMARWVEVSFEPCASSPTLLHGRAGEAPSTGLTEALVELGFETARLKTGTPARVDSRTVNFSGLQAQPGDSNVRWFSFDPEVCPALTLGLFMPKYKLGHHIRPACSDCSISTLPCCIYL